MDPGLAFTLGFLIAFSVALLLALWRLPFVRKEVLDESRERHQREASAAAKEQLYLERGSFENALAATRAELAEREERCRLREDALDGRLERLEAREGALGAREGELKQQRAALEVREAEVERAHQRELRELERVASMRREEAEHLLLERVEQSCCEEAAAVRDKVEGQLQSGVAERARELLLVAMRRQASRAAREDLVTTVQLVDDELKLALVGREGRNARAFAAATGVDLLIDDTPGAVVLSAFEPVRREIARRALEVLLEDGRIHPERIQEVVKEARLSMDDAVRGAGAAAAEEAGVAELHPRLVTLLGRLEFHLLHGRNARLHAVESARLAAALAAELGLDPALARRAALLLDVGRAIEQDGEGNSAEVGADFARRCDEDPRVVDAIARGAREGVEVASPYAAVAQLASRVARKRPGAADPGVEQAVARREELERIAERHPGVKRAYAVQAGRVLRVIVDPTTVSERGATRLAREIAKEISQAEALPGEVSVSVIRETRAEETAS
ncbi:MAG: Rnase Y domain-containing protein [Planctomycetota bacterium]